jgi:hypothetical protein
MPEEQAGQPEGALPAPEGTASEASQSTERKLAFLSEAWLAEARRLRREHAGNRDGPQDGSPHRIRVNQVVTGVPFGDGTLHVHLDTSGGAAVLEVGHIADPDVTITLDYQVARAIFVERNPQAPMRAFMTGQLRVDGDVTALIDVQRQMLGVSSPTLAARVQDITV